MHIGQWTRNIFIIEKGGWLFLGRLVDRRGKEEGPRGQGVKELAIWNIIQYLRRILARPEHEIVGVKHGKIGGSVGCSLGKKEPSRKSECARRECPIRLRSNGQLGTNMAMKAAKLLVEQIYCLWGSGSAREKTSAGK